MGEEGARVKGSYQSISTPAGVWSRSLSCEPSVLTEREKEMSALFDIHITKYYVAISVNTDIICFDGLFKGKEKTISCFVHISTKKMKYYNWLVRTVRWRGEKKALPALWRISTVATETGMLQWTTLNQRIFVENFNIISWNRSTSVRSNPRVAEKNYIIRIGTEENSYPKGIQ